MYSLYIVCVVHNVYDRRCTHATTHEQIVVRIPAVCIQMREACVHRVCTHTHAHTHTHTHTHRHTPAYIYACTFCTSSIMYTLTQRRRVQRQSVQRLVQQCNQYKYDGTHRRLTNYHDRLLDIIYIYICSKHTDRYSWTRRLQLTTVDRLPRDGERWRETEVRRTDAKDGRERRTRKTDAKDNQRRSRRAACCTLMVHPECDHRRCVLPGCPMTTSSSSSHHTPRVAGSDGAAEVVSLPRRRG